uniref:Uncharacterized protein n=1 Tax=Glossina austeni TaxID=7395 RepID=A0A1A9VSJ1_GLOAU
MNTIYVAFDQAFLRIGSKTSHIAATIPDSSPKVQPGFSCFIASTVSRKNIEYADTGLVGSIGSQALPLLTFVANFACSRDATALLVGVEIITYRCSCVRHVFFSINFKK